MERFPVRRNTILLAATLTSLSGMVQLAVAVGTVTLVLVTGIEGILGLGPAIFLTAGALAALPAGAARANEVSAAVAPHGPWDYPWVDFVSPTGVTR